MKMGDLSNRDSFIIVVIIVSINNTTTTTTTTTTLLMLSLFSNCSKKKFWLKTSIMFLSVS